MRIKVRYLGTAILLGGYLFACNSQETIDHLTQEIGPEVSIATISPSVATTEVASLPAPSPSSSPISAPWGIIETTEDYFFDNAYFPPGCQLPCWEGLVIGESTFDDLEMVLKRVLGNLPQSTMFKDENLLPGLTFIVDGWEIQDVDDEYLGRRDLEIVALVDTSNVLQALHFGMSHKPFNEYISPKRVITELGPPDHLLIGIEQVVDAGMARLVLVYDQGMTFYFRSKTPFTYIHSDNNVQKYTIEYCFGNRLINDPDYAIEASDVILMRPLSNGLNDLLPEQAAYITSWTEDFGLVSVEEYFRMSIDQVVSLIMQDDEACLTTEITGE